MTHSHGKTGFNDKTHTHHLTHLPQKYGKNNFMDTCIHKPQISRSHLLLNATSIIAIPRHSKSKTAYKKK